MKLFRGILVVLHVSVLALLLGTFLNAYVPPQIFPWFNLLSLGFPVLMILHVILTFLWIIFRKKRAIFFLVFSVIFLNPVKRWVNFTEESTEKPNLKIVTFNIKGGAKKGMEPVYDYLKNTDADIILAQEYGSEFNIPGYPHRTNLFPIVALNSKTEILHQEKLATVGNGSSFYADIKFEGKIIRLVNVYLNPFSFEKKMVKPVEDYTQNKAKIRDILKKLIPTFKMHQREISDIRTAIDKSPYPVILAGDFNAVPNSYEYYTLGKDLTDAFVKTGKGSATSFHDYKFPLRIDYVFTSKEIKPVNYTVDRSVKLSDHFPVIAEFKID